MGNMIDEPDGGRKKYHQLDPNGVGSRRSFAASGRREVSDFVCGTALRGLLSSTTLGWSLEFLAVMDELSSRVAELLLLSEQASAVSRTLRDDTTHKG